MSEQENKTQETGVAVSTNTVKMPAMSMTDRDTLISWLQGLPVVDVRVVETPAEAAKLDGVETATEVMTEVNPSVESQT